MERIGLEDIEVLEHRRTVQGQAGSGRLPLAGT